MIMIVTQNDIIQWINHNATVMYYEIQNQFGVQIDVFGYFLIEKIGVVMN